MGRDSGMSRKRVLSGVICVLKNSFLLKYMMKYNSLKL